jgi:hypothetical protein
MEKEERPYACLAVVLFFFGCTYCSFYFLDAHHINYNLQILFELLAKGGTVKGLIKEKDLVQVSNYVRSLYRYKSFQW